MNKETKNFLIKTAITMGVLTGVAIAVAGTQGFIFNLPSGGNWYFSRRVFNEMKKLDKKYGLFDTFNSSVSGNTIREKRISIETNSLKNIDELEEPMRSIIRRVIKDWYVVSRTGQPYDIITNGSIIVIAYNKGLIPYVVETRRTLSRQYKLYTQGYGSKSVTKAEPPYSNHVLGLACDIWFYDLKNDKFNWKDLCSLNHAIYRLIKDNLDNRIVWGGLWDNFKDCPHFEINIRNAIKEPSRYNDLSTLVPKYEEMATDYYNAMSSMGYACKVDSATLKLYDCIHRPGEK